MTGTVEVRLVDFVFSPARVTLSRGATVRWRNTTNTFHTVTPDGHSEFARWETSQSGNTTEHTFDQPGTFEFFCEPHRAIGMTGTIVVQ